MCYYVCMVKNEIDWLAKAEADFGVDVVDEWCWEVDCLEPEWFDESCYNSIARGEV